MEIVPNDFEDNDVYEEDILDHDVPGGHTDHLPLAERAANPMGL
jgi:hypothetical protein